MKTQFVSELEKGWRSLLFAHLTPAEYPSFSFFAQGEGTRTAVLCSNRHQTTRAPDFETQIPKPTKRD